jgi:hypothetical protein
MKEIKYLYSIGELVLANRSDYKSDGSFTKFQREALVIGYVNIDGKNVGYKIVIKDKHSGSGMITRSSEGALNPIHDKTSSENQNSADCNSIW